MVQPADEIGMVSSQSLERTVDQDDRAIRTARLIGMLSEDSDHDLQSRICGRPVITGGGRNCRPVDHRRVVDRSKDCGVRTRRLDDGMGHDARGEFVVSRRKSNSELFRAPTVALGGTPRSRP